MTQITAAQVKELRDRTSAGMMECKKALVAAEGDIEKAIDEMRKSGQAKAVKRAGRIASEGTVVTKIEADKAVMLEINCETDFVAKDKNLIEFAKQVADSAFANEITDVAKLAECTLATGETIENTRTQLVAKIGENISIRRIAFLKTNNNIGSYIHSGRIGVLVEVKGGDDVLAKDLAMHIAASSPMVINPEDMPEAEVEREKQIFIAQAQESGKPMEIIEKMIQGRMRKFFDEVCLVGQPFVKDPDTKISQLLKQNGAEVVNFTRYVVGEGIEKEESNFAEEVMQQVRG